MKSKSTTNGKHVFALSARTEELLDEMLNTYGDYLDKNPHVSVGDICSTACKGRGHYSFRLAIIVKSTEELREKMKKPQGTGGAKGASLLEDAYYGKHCIVMNKAERQTWEITEEEKIALTEKINRAIERRIDKGGTYEEILEDVCSAYVNGADINWELVYRTGAFSTISAPVYKFERKRSWVDDAPEVQTPAAKTDEAASEKLSHPMLDRCMVRIMNETIFYTEFSVDRFWVLKEHRITGKNVVPGTTYIEMALAAGREYYRQDALTLKNLQFYTPLVCEKNQLKSVYTVLKKDSEKVLFTIMSHEEGNENKEEHDWTQHCTGELYPITTEKPAAYDMGSLLSRFGEEMDLVRKKKGIMEFGTRWDCSRKVRLGVEEALVNLELAVQVREDTSSYILHPALMDVATSIGANSIPHNSFYLPFAYGELHLYENMPSNIYSRISPLLGEKHADSEILKYDVEIIDQAGNIVASVKDFTLKRVHDVRKRMRELSNNERIFYRKGWMEEPLQPDKTQKPDGCVLVFSDNGGVGESLVKRLQGEDINVLNVRLGEKFSRVSETEFILSGSQQDYIQLFNEVASRHLAQIVHLQTIDDNKAPESVQNLEESQKKGVYSLFHIVNALYNNRIARRIKILLVGKNVGSITGEESYLRPDAASLFGLARVAASENPALSCRCMDMDDETGVDEIISEMKAGSTAFLTAYRRGKRHVEVLNKVNDKKLADVNTGIKPEGVYLITGGTGGIGLEISKYISSRESVNLALVSRSKLPGRNEWDRIIQDGADRKMASRLAKIKEIEEDTLAVDIFSADVSSHEDMKRVIDSLLEKYGRINGIIHSAGIAGDGFIVKKDFETFRNVLLPKVNGTWILDNLTKNCNLDFFILFSSIASTYGEPGQGDYTAANSYLDAYAAYRSRNAGRTIVINWPAWRETGMAVDYGAISDSGISRALTTQEGINIFEEILESNLVSVIPIQLNIENLNLNNIENQFPMKISGEVKDELIKLSAQAGVRERISSDKKYPERRTKITGKDEEDFTELEITVARLWAEVLGLEHIDVYESFYSMGGDSLQAIQLLKKMEEKFPGLLNISDIFSYSTVSELSGYIENKANQKVKSVKKLESQSIGDVLAKLASGEIDVEQADRLINLGDE